VLCLSLSRLFSPSDFDLWGILNKPHRFSSCIWQSLSHQLGDSVVSTRLVAQQVMGSTLIAAALQLPSEAVYTANNCDFHHVVVMGRLFTHRGGA